MFLRDADELKEVCEMLNAITENLIAIDKNITVVKVSQDSLEFVINRAYVLISELYNAGANASVIVEQIPYSDVVATLMLNDSNNKLSERAFNGLTEGARTYLHRMCWSLRGDERNIMGGINK